MGKNPDKTERRASGNPTAKLMIFENGTSELNGIKLNFPKRRERRLKKF